MALLYIRRVDVMPIVPLLFRKALLYIRRVDVMPIVPPLFGSTGALQVNGTQSQKEVPQFGCLWIECSQPRVTDLLDFIPCRYLGPCLLGAKLNVILDGIPPYFGLLSMVVTFLWWWAWLLDGITLAHLATGGRWPGEFGCEATTDTLPRARGLVLTFL